MMMNLRIYYLICTCILFVTTAESGRILAIHPIRAQSHFHFHQSIMNSLVAAGHHVTIVSPFPPANPSENFTHVDSRVDEIEDDDPFSKFDFKYMSFWEAEEVLALQSEAECYEVMKLKQINELLKSNEKKYDLMFLELFPLYQCYLPIAMKQGIPIIGTLSMRSWLTVDNLMGNPRNPAVLPMELLFMPKSMTFYQRLKNIIYHVMADLYYQMILIPRVKKFNTVHCPSCDVNTMPRISLAFVNNHPSYFSRASGPTTVEIGGIHLKTKLDPLPEELKKFIEEARHGVILFTFGTITKSNTIGLKMRNVFRDAFAQIPQRIIWKFEDDIENLSDNVLLSPWVPQMDILSHENVKAFISHCGMHGTYEAIYTGKPVISVPVFGDQPSNAAFLKELGVAVYVDILSLTTEKLVSALHAVVNDTSYYENMQKLSRTFRDRPMSPEKTVVYWTEYVLRYNGTEHLTSAALDMPLYQYLLLDIILFIMTALVTVVLILTYFSKKLYSFCTNKNKIRELVATEKKLR